MIRYQYHGPCSNPSRFRDRLTSLWCRPRRFPRYLRNLPDRARRQMRLQMNLYEAMARAGRCGGSAGSRHGHGSGSHCTAH